MQLDSNKVVINILYIEAASNDAESNNEFAYNMQIDCKNNVRLNNVITSFP